MLLVGPINSGKTLFLKRYQAYTAGETFHDDDGVQSTVPTVGTNMCKLSISRRESVDIRELGGCMAPIWKKYYAEANALLFMADKSNPQQLAASTILLLDILSDDNMQGKPVAVIWNKIDLPSSMRDGQVANAFDLDKLKTLCSQKISVLNCSCITGEGFDKITQWLHENTVISMMVASCFSSRLPSHRLRILEAGELNELEKFAVRARDLVLQPKRYSADTATYTQHNQQSNDNTSRSERKLLQLLTNMEIPANVNSMRQTRPAANLGKRLSSPNRKRCFYHILTCLGNRRG